MTRLMSRLHETALESPDEAAERLRSFSRTMTSEDGLEPLIERIGDARYVLLGAASHGTSEFHAARIRITQQLVQHHGFSFVAMEGNWPDCHRINRYVKGYESAGDDGASVLGSFERWPTWMMANREMEGFLEWLRYLNSRRDEDERVGFYGLDVYDWWESMATIVDYLDHVAPEAGQRVRRVSEWPVPLGDEPEADLASAALMPRRCEEEIVNELVSSMRTRARAEGDGADSYFAVQQHALIARNAELYYRTMVGGGTAAWNVRSGHLADTLDRLVGFHGPNAKVVVWQHDAQAGDARFTDMPRLSRVSVGQLLRERHEREGVVLVGFSSHRGTVIAAREWGAPPERMHLPDAREGSWEDVLHRLGVRSSLILLPRGQVPGSLLEPRGHREIGVVYPSEQERYGNYVPTVLPLRYDAMLFTDATHAITPVHAPASVRGATLPRMALPDGL